MNRPPSSSSCYRSSAKHRRLLLSSLAGWQAHHYYRCCKSSGRKPAPHSWGTAQGGIAPAHTRARSRGPACTAGRIRGTATQTRAPPEPSWGRRSTARGTAAC